ncbi:MAG: single-stranded DNA-binding protein [Spirochaetaceae bacterium]|jgi:single-strand DNA-binding protein|nr:single-stranded DNA-binding protein [Spirochaetaceae bacterium]
MADINRALLSGRLTRDAELKYTAGGQAVCKFSIAVNRRRKNGDQWVDEPNFFDVVLWGRQGEALNQYLIKGKTVTVDGELRQDRWEQDGQNRSKIEVVANTIVLGGNPGGGGNSGGASGGGSRVNAGGNAEGGYSGGDRDRWSAPGNAGATDRSGPETREAPPDDGFTDDIPF